MGKSRRFIRTKQAKKKLKSLFKGKVPDGVVPELGISETRRDELSKRDFSGPRKLTLQEKDPNTLDTKELKEIRFSGIRNNNWTNMCEIWVDGRVMASADASKVVRDPSILAEMHERVFQTAGSLVDIEPAKKG